jgi:tyrosinase
LYPRGIAGQGAGRAGKIFDEMAGSSPISRRHVLSGGVALAAAAAPARRGAAVAPVRYRRWNISDPACPARVVASYKTAIRAMLALPADDPRNWYRYTLIHTLDCAHGNWWFLPWHRAYLAWFERICRELSGDPEFALPYWDWTSEPRVPKAMFEDVLDPNDRAFIADADAFEARYKDAVAAAGYWSMTRNAELALRPSPQHAQLLARGLRSAEDLWFHIVKDPSGPMFFDQPHARALSASEAELTVAQAPSERQPVLVAVSMATLRDALAPRDFISFAGPKAPAHSDLSGFGVLESQPHSLVHECLGGGYNGTGGFMRGLMSPVDPIFYLHHANIDRLWDLWMRKQRALGLPILPEGYPAAPGLTPRTASDYAAWASEPFLFFVDAKGNSVRQNIAGAYAEIGDFGYDYAPGSGEGAVTAAPPPAEVAAAPRKTLPAQLVSSRIAGKEAARGSVTLPSSLLKRQDDPRQPRPFASVTISVPPHRHANFDVLIASADGVPPVFVGSLLTFGHHGAEGPVSFLVPLSAALARLQAGQPFSADTTLEIEIQRRPGHQATTAEPPGASDVRALAIELL